MVIEGDIERLLRELAPQVLGSIMRRYRDLAACEDAVQEAMIAAAEQWPREGVPDTPRGWLIQVALRRMTDHVRSEIARRTREYSLRTEESLVVAPELYSEPGLHPDDALILLFMCCHPALSSASAIALTLRAVGGLTTGEIAKAFLVPEATMGQRISRAKQLIAESKAAFEMPDAIERADRLSSVLHVLYLIFNEGYAATAGADLVRVDLSNEAIRLTRSLRQLLPNDSEVTALLSLMLLTDARRTARSGSNGELIPLDEQNRALWDRRQIDEGVSLLKSLPGEEFGEYRLQASIAAVHDEAANIEATDWPQILILYGALMSMSDNPMVALNYAVALAMVQGPGAGLDFVASLAKDRRLVGHHRVDAVRAHLFERAGDRSSAITAYRSAAEKTSSIPERNYLTLRAARLAEQEVVSR